MRSYRRVDNNSGALGLHNIGSSAKIDSGMDYATTVEEAVKRFYSTGSNEAHTWILQVQASPEAWTFVWQLLDPSKVTVGSMEISDLVPFHY